VKTALKKQIPYIIFFDKQRLKETGTVRAKKLATREEKDIPRAGIVEYLRGIFG